MVAGTTGQSTIHIKDSGGTWHEITSYETFKVEKRQNQASLFEVTIQSIESTEKAYIKEFSEIIFFSELNLILKGRIQKVDYHTSYSCKINGYGMEGKLLEKELIKSNDKRVQYTNSSAQTIANEILSENTDGSSPWIIQPDSGGIFSSDYGNITMRFEHANRLNSIAKLAESINYEWGVTHSVDFLTDYFNVATYLPSVTRATTSQKTFLITGANANAIQTRQKRDVTNLANKIDVLGYGDGINQISVSTYNASPTFSSLSSDITSSSTTISLTDASSFASSGEIRIMSERVTYSGKSGNDLTGCTRGANSTTAKPHKKNVYVEKYVAIGSPEANSSISDNGLLDYTITNNDLIDEETAELVASNELLKRKDIIVRIIVNPDEPLDISGELDIGDLVTITDAESDLDDDFRIVGMIFKSYYGGLTLELECSNKTLDFIEQMNKQRKEADNLAKYMQGSTNIYAVSEAENCDSSNYLNLRFFIPNEAIAINKVLLNFKLKDYRAYSTGASSTAASSTSSDTGEYINHYPALFDVGTEFNNSTITFTPGYIVPSSPTGTFDGCIVTVTNSNLTGTNQTSGSIRIKNLTTGVILQTISSISINDTDAKSTNFSFTSSQVSAGDELEVRFTNTYTGTDSTYTRFGGFSVDIAAKSTHTHTSTHTHDITYGIQEQTLVSPSVDLYIGEDGGSMTSFATYTTDQEEIDVTSEVQAVGAGKWVNLQFRPNKNMRIEANNYIQIFIDSS